MSTAGQLVAELLAQILQKSMKDLKSTLTKYLNEGRPIDVLALMKEKAVTHGLKYAISTGNWSANKIAGNKSGVSAVLMRLNYISTLSHLRRINTPVGRDGKLSKPRHLSGTHWGMVCCSETPEGESVGLVKNLALLTHISLGDYSFHFHDIIFKYGTIPLHLCTHEQIAKWTAVFANGRWMGMVLDARTLANKMEEMKTSCQINYETSIVHDREIRELRFRTDPGRCMRPLANVKEKMLLITKERIKQLRENRSTDSFMHLLMSGYVEYVDVEEEEKSMIAMFPEYLKEDKQYTHCEIHPASILGVAAASIPFANHNPAARNTFQVKNVCVEIVTFFSLQWSSKPSVFSVQILINAWTQCHICFGILKNHW